MNSFQKQFSRLIVAFGSGGADAKLMREKAKEYERALGWIPEDGLREVVDYAIDHERWFPTVAVLRDLWTQFQPPRQSSSEIDSENSSHAAEVEQIKHEIGNASKDQLEKLISWIEDTLNIKRHSPCFDWLAVGAWRHLKNKGII